MIFLFKLVKFQISEVRGFHGGVHKDKVIKGTEYFLLSVVLSKIVMQDQNVTQVTCPASQLD